MDEERLDSFSDGDPYHIEIRPLTSRTNQWTGFYTTEEFAMKEFILCYLHLFIKIYSLIMTNYAFGIYASKYPGGMLLISPLSENLTVEKFNTRKTYKAYIDFGIFSFIFYRCNL